MASLDTFSALLIAAITIAWLSMTPVRAAVENPASLDGYQLSTQKEFLIIAPHKIRPLQTYEMYVTMLQLHYSEITVKAILSRNGEEYATTQETFYEKGTKRMQLMIPERISQGQHKLIVQGLVSRGRGDPIFHNETVLTFHPKYVSLFIQTDRIMYYHSETVNFRIVGVTPDLKPVHGQDMTIYVKDSLGNTVRRWLNQELIFGMYSSSFELTYPTQVGEWHLEVDAYGTTYRQAFHVDFFYRRIFEINVTTPLYVFDTDWGLLGSMYSEHQSGVIVKGNCTLSLKVRNMDGTFKSGEIIRKIAYETGTMPFSFSMSEIKAEFGTVVDKELYVEAWVYDFYFLETQNGTSVTRVIKDGIELKRLGGKYRTFKPEIPFTVYFAVRRSDNTPYTGHYNRQVLVQVDQRGTGPSQQIEERVIIPDDAIIRYQVVPRKSDTKIKIMASHLPTGSPKEIWAYRYYSQNNKYLSMTTSTEAPVTEQYMTFTVRTNFMVSEINYVITAAGNILLGSTLTMTSQQKTFAVALSRKMSPLARMVVYCVSDEEVLMDTLTFFVRDTRLYGASLRINQGKDFSHKTIEIIGKGDAGGFLSTVGMDYEWYKRGADTFIDEEKVINELLTYDEPSEGAYRHIWWHDSAKWEESVFFPAHTGGVDIGTTANVSGLVVMSDMNYTVKQEFTACNRSLGVGICLDFTCYALKKTCDGWPDCEFDAFDEMACPLREEDTPERRDPDFLNLHKFFRYFTDTSFVWTTSYVKPTGQVELQVEVAEDTLPLVLSGFILHPEHGLSLIPEVVQYDTTRPFYTSLEYPEVTRRGEQIGLRLSLFSAWDEDVETLITLHGGENHRFIHVEDYGYVSSYSPRLSAGDVQVMLELRAGTQKYILFPILPLVAEGEVTVRISSYCPFDRDVVEANFEVMYEGVASDNHIPFFMDLNNKGSQLAPYFDIPMPEQFVIPGRRELIYIPGSNVANVYVYGDVVSPGFFEDHLDADSVAGVQHDSAEGYMYDYAINLQTLQYLQATRALEDSVAQKALEYMQSILMRQYAYMQPDGSFKMFRRTDNPCVWVTSFILKTLHRTQMTDWSVQVYVPIETLNKIALWLISQQDSSGAFIETADNYYDRNMWPTTIDPDGVEHEWHIPVTAHVLITLASGSRLTGAAKIQGAVAIEKAAQYLADKIQAITDPFQMAITAYALQLANHKDRDGAYIKLQGMAFKDEHMYWASSVIEPNPAQTINAKFYIQVRSDYENLENAVMATSYALMLYIQHNDMDNALPIMRWLIAQHNDFMAWSSTQDGLLALEALTSFALEESNREFFQIEAEISATSMPNNWGGRLTVNRTNFFDLQTFDLPNAWGEISVSLQGTGYGFVGVTTEYNADKTEFLDNPDFDTFSIRVAEKRFTGRNASQMIMTPCVGWMRTDIAPTSGMALVEVEIPTGYILNRDAIMALYRSRTPGLRRARFRDGTLIVFLEYVPALPQETCFTFEATRWFPVANISITHGLGVSEYSETGLGRADMYDTYTLFHLHICQVCGSFQCPYCPNYNSSPSSHRYYDYTHLLVFVVLHICFFVL